jgi:hypothetical protein
MQEYETKCYQALLDDGCRPLFLISLLLQVSTNADAYRDLLRPWTRYPGTSNPEDWQVFSRQLRRWKEFRKWQLGNRRQTVGFSEYLNEQQREFERMGVAAGWTARPDFEQAIRSQWEDEYGHGQQQPGNGDDAEAVLSRYAEATKRLLMNCGFVQPFELHADPKQQGQWTTYVEYVEYLAFECFWLGQFARSAQKLRVQHDAGWEGLVKAGVVEPIDAVGDLASTEVEDMRERELERVARAARSFTAATCTTATDTAKETCTQTTRRPRTRHGQNIPSHPQKSLQSPQSPIDGIAPRNDLVDEYVHNTQKYQSAKAETDHQQRRVEWVQSEISKIAAEQKTAGKSSSSVGTKSRKRKPTDDATDDADVEPRVAKHRRTDETEKMVVRKSDNSRTTRSKKRKLPTDQDTREPQLKIETKVAGETDGPGTKSRKRRKAIHEQHGSEDPSSVLEPSLGTAVVSVQVSSTVSSNSRPRRQVKRISRGTAAVGSRDERLKTLRPRVDGKVAVVRGLKTRGGEAARKARGRPRSTHSRPKVT